MPYEQTVFHNRPDGSTPLGATLLNAREEHIGTAFGAVESRCAALEARGAIVIAATGTAATDTADVLTAIGDAPVGGTVLLRGTPGGYYAMQDTIAIKDKPVHLIGVGGMAQTNSSAPFIREAGTKLYMTANKPLIHVCETNYTSIESQGSSVRDLALEGNLTGGSQEGLWVDNRGTGCRFQNLMIAGMGNHGVVIGDSVAAIFDNVISLRNVGDGWRLDHTRGTDSANAAVTDNVFIGCLSLANGGHGYVLQGVVWGNVWIGGDTEGNTGYGFIIDAVGVGAQPRFNQTRGLWIEGNGDGSLRIATAAATDNDLDFLRMDTTPTFVSANAQMANSLHYADLSLGGRAQRKTWQHTVLRGGGLTSSDLDAVTVRSRDDSGDGKVRAAAFVATVGLTLGPGGELTTSVPLGVDALNAANGHGVTVRNAANTANKQILSLGSDDKTHVGSDAGPVHLENVMQMPATAAASVPNGSMFIDSADNKLKFKDSAGAVNALY